MSTAEGFWSSPIGDNAWVVITDSQRPTAGELEATKLLAKGKGERPTASGLSRLALHPALGAGQWGRL